MKNTCLKFGLPIALLSAFSIFGNEEIKEPQSVEQKDESKHRRIGFDFDMFWSQSSFRHFGGYHKQHVKHTDRYEGLRFTEQNLKPNGFYSGSDLWFAVGNHNVKYYLDGKKEKEKNWSTNLWLNGDVGLGYNFQPSFSPNFLLSVFAGPGFHYEKKFHHAAAWGYAMAGFKMAQDLTKSLSLGVDFKTMYSYGVRDRFNVTAPERRGERHFWGIELGTPLTWHIGEARKLDLQFKPYLLKFNVNSRETILGARVGLGYTF